MLLPTGSKKTSALCTGECENTFFGFYSLLLVHNLLNVLSERSNIPENQVENGEVNVEFLPPIPFEKSGDHRYIFLLLEQPGRLEAKEPVVAKDTVSGRSKFNVEKFISENKLKKKGVSFFRTSWSKDMNKLYDNLKLLDGEKPVFSLFGQKKMSVREKVIEKFW